MPNSIKRIEALKPLSREHHYGLLLCWKIRTGIKKNVAIERIKRYTDWYWKNHLSHHFEMEETYVFSILGNDHSLIKQAKAEHRKLKGLFESTEASLESISLIEEELEKHIRFEERVLFNEIQKVATAQDLEKISLVHTIDLQNEWADEFWVS
ncbi:MAG: hemerythrin domain-containing protein [Sphingobacteriales bacterium]|nr:hemerythrin domain-containing protein [Sphingobacteriales bacterium]